MNDGLAQAFFSLRSLHHLRLLPGLTPHSRGRLSPPLNFMLGNEWDLSILRGTVVTRHYIGKECNNFSNITFDSFRLDVGFFGYGLIIEAIWHGGFLIWKAKSHALC